MNKKEGNEMIWPAWLSVILGSIGIGAIVTTAVICFSDGFNETVRWYIIWIIASALYGFSSLFIFRNDNLSLPAALASHAVICYIITIVAARLCRFNGGLAGNILPISISFIVIYTVIFCILHFSSKAEEKKINKKLNCK